MVFDDVLCVEVIVVDSFVEQSFVNEKVFLDDKVFQFVVVHQYLLLMILEIEKIIKKKIDVWMILLVSLLIYDNIYVIYFCLVVQLFFIIILVVVDKV